VVAQGDQVGRQAAALGTQNIGAAAGVAEARKVGGFVDQLDSDLWDIPLQAIVTYEQVYAMPKETNA
jgi:hypothetical protein